MFRNARIAIRSAQVSGRNDRTGITGAWSREAPTKGKLSNNRSPADTQTSRHPIVRGKGPRRLLEPHVLSQRLKKLCEGGQLEAAVDTLKNAPSGAQSTPVWNTLIWEVLKVHRWNLAYKLYTDMKRRGLSPTTRTFQTMFGGLSRVDHWAAHSRLLDQVHQLYDYFLKHLEAVKYHTPDSDELTISPLAMYIKILGDVGDFQRIFDVYYAMDSEGPLSPNRDIFTAIFQVLSVERNVDGDESAIFHKQNSSTAKLLWTQMEKASKKSPGFEVDSHLIAVGIRTLSRGSSADQECALDIIRDHLGLVRPGELSVNFANTQLSVFTLAAALECCNVMQNPRACIHYLQQVMHPRYSTPQVIRQRAHVIDRGHIEQGLKAYATLAQSRIPGQSICAVETLQWMLRSEITQNNAKLRPELITFNLVLSVCRAQGDWAGVTRTFDLMSGYQSGDFTDSEALKGTQPVMTVRSSGRNLAPDAEAMLSMVRTSLATQVPANIRQSLRMVNHFDVDHLLSTERNGVVNLPPPTKVAKQKSFIQKKLAVALMGATRTLTRTKIAREADPEAPLWLHLLSRAKAYLAVRRGG